MYGKHFSSTYTGSMLGAGANVFAVWGFIIANTVKGVVELNPILTATMLGMTVNEVNDAVEWLSQPDEHSRNDDRDGARLVRIGPFAHEVVSHAIYNKMKNEDDRRAYNREKKRESRARQAKNGAKPEGKRGECLTVNDMSLTSTMSAHTEADSEADSETDTQTKPCVSHPVKRTKLFSSIAGVPHPSDPTKTYSSAEYVIEAFKAIGRNAGQDITASAIRHKERASLELIERLALESIEGVDVGRERAFADVVNRRFNRYLQLMREDSKIPWKASWIAERWPSLTRAA